VRRGFQPGPCTLTVVNHGPATRYWPPPRHQPAPIRTRSTTRPPPPSPLSST